MMFWKKKKFWIILTTTVIVLFTAISLFAGNYLVDYALYVDENGRVGSMGDYDLMPNRIPSYRKNLTLGSVLFPYRNGKQRAKTD